MKHVLTILIIVFFNDYLLSDGGISVNGITNLENSIVHNELFMLTLLLISFCLLVFSFYFYLSSRVYYFLKAKEISKFKSHELDVLVLIGGLAFAIGFWFIIVPKQPDLTIIGLIAYYPEYYIPAFLVPSLILSFASITEYLLIPTEINIDSDRNFNRSRKYGYLIAIFSVMADLITLTVFLTSILN